MAAAAVRPAHDDRLRLRILLRGGRWGVRALRLALALADTDGDGRVSLDPECLGALASFGLGTTPPAELRAFVAAFDIAVDAPTPTPARAAVAERDGGASATSAWTTTAGRAFAGRGSGAPARTTDPSRGGAAFAAAADSGVSMAATVRVADFVDAAAGGLPSPQRQRAVAYCYRRVCAAFQRSEGARMAPAGPGAPTVAFLCSEARLDIAHPDVVSSAVPLREALLCFFSLWGAPLEHPVGANLFSQFFADWSAAFAADADFCAFVFRLWGADPAAAAAELADDGAGAMIAPTRAASDAIFASIDCNGNGTLSLAELDLAVIRLWPQHNSKAAIMRAYKLADASGNGWLDKAEFFRFCHFLVQYSALMSAFRAVDTDRSGSLTLDELLRGKQRLRLGDESDVALRSAFREMDSNNGGKVLFEEFCVYMAKRRGLAAMEKVTNQF